jgi:hypothetical protein
MIQDTAEAIMKQLVNDRETFTAYDVTEEVRSKMPSINVYHYKLRQLIHDFMDTYVNDGSYDKEQDFDKHPNGPFVFSPKRDVVVNQPPVTVPFPTVVPNVRRSAMVDLVYGRKPSTSTQPHRKFYNVRDKNGKFTSK